MSSSSLQEGQLLPIFQYSAYRILNHHHTGPSLATLCRNDYKATKFGGFIINYIILD